MRRIYLLLLLCVAYCAQGSAAVVLGDQLAASDIKDGALIAISGTNVNSTSSVTTDWEGYWLANTSVATKTFSPITVWKVVYKGTTDTDGNSEFYLVNYADNKYLGAISPDGNRMGGFKTTVIDSARTFTVKAYEGSTKNAYISDKTVVMPTLLPGWPELTRYQCLSLSPNGLDAVQGTYDMINFLSDDKSENGIPLNVYAVSEKQDYAADLQSVIDRISESGGEYPAGTDPGYYDASVVNDYETAFTTAMNLLASGSATDQQLIAARENLENTWALVKTAIIPPSEGYYYIVSAYDEFLNHQGVEKAMTVNDSIATWGTLDTANPDYIWQLTASDESHFYIYNLGASRYLEHSDGPWGSAGLANQAMVSEEPTTAQTIPTIGNGLVNVTAYWMDPSGRFANSFPYCVRGDDTGQNDTGYVGVGSGGISTPISCWYLRRVGDDMLKNIGEIIAANNRVKTLRSLVEDANNLVDKILLYKTSGEGLITTAGNTLSGNQITFSTVRTQGIGGADDYKFLIDGLDSTYMQGAGTISVNLSATPVDSIAIYYNTRGATWERPSAGQWGLDERPANVVLYASKSTGEDSAWVKIDSTDMTTLGVPATWYVPLGDKYSYLRLVVKNNALGNNYFTLGEFQVYKYEADKDNSQYFTVSGMKAAVDALKVQTDSASAAVNRKSVSEEQITAMQNAIAAVRALYSDTTSLKELITEAQTLAATATVGDQIGDLTDESATTTLQSAISAAQDESLYTTPLNKAGIDKATSDLNNAMTAFRAAVRMPDPNKWYYIRSLTSTDVRSGEAGTSDAQCYGSVLYTRGNNITSSLSWGYVSESGEMTNMYAPSTMWRIVPIEGTDNYALQNLGSGLYLGAFVSNNTAAQQSESEQPYAVQLLGNRQFALTSQASTNSKNLSLYCGGAQTNVIATTATLNGNGAWGFEEVNVDEIEGISINEFANNMIDVMTLPYDVTNIADYNNDVQTYGIRKITQEENAEGELVSTIELYKKDTIRAGEPVIIILGDTAQDVPCEDFDLFFPFPSEVTSTPVAANGLTGVLSEARCAKGTGISTAKKFIPMEQDGNVPSQTGVIDPSKYMGEVTGVETAYILTAVGLNPLPTGQKADVNNDGEINSADIAVVYNFIANGEQSGYTKDALDVNGDGEINSSDVANIYAQIAGGDAASKTFAKKIMKLLQAK